MKIHTIGYNGLKIEEFISILERLKIDQLVDIRARPLSRKPGFSKTKLGIRLEKSGIEYVHFKALGSPKELRVEYQESGNVRKFFESLGKVFSSAESVEQLTSVIDEAAQRNVCLMCCCADWMYCHRKAVVDELLSRCAIDVNHVVFDSKSKTTEIQEIAVSRLKAA